MSWYLNGASVGTGIELLFSQFFNENFVFPGIVFWTAWIPSLYSSLPKRGTVILSAGQLRFSRYSGIVEVDYDKILSVAKKPTGFLLSSPTVEITFRLRRRTFFSSARVMRMAVDWYDDELESAFRSFVPQRLSWPGVRLNFLHDHDVFFAHRLGC